MRIKTSKLKCNVTVELADQYKIEAKVSSWFPRMEVDIVLSDPDLLALEHISTNKLQRGDRAGYEYNVDRFLELLDDLVRSALSIAKVQILDLQRRASIFIMVLVVCSTVLYFWKPLAGIAIDVIVGAAFIFFCWFIERQKYELNTFVHTQKATFADRAVKLRREFEQAELGGR